MYCKLFLLTVLILISACRETIVHNLSEPEANRMLAHLDAENLQVVKEKQADGRWALSLPQSQAALAIRSLAENKLLREELPAIPEKSSFVMSRDEERFRYERALSREIEATLAGLPAVLQARVHLNLPLSDPIFGHTSDASKSSASVMLITNSAGTDKTEIMALVAGASGVPSQAISVLISKRSEAEKNNPSAVVQSENISEPQGQDKLQDTADTLTAQPANPAEEQKIKKTWLNRFSANILFYLKGLPWLTLSAAVAFPLLLILVLRILNRKPRLII